MVQTYWLIGREIVEVEQVGEQRANYGKNLLARLSEKLQAEYKRGFGIDTLKQARKIYVIYQTDRVKKLDAVRRKLSTTPSFSSNLSWIHYRALIRVKRVEARKFYEKEAIENCWSARELERQIGSLLFDRLAKSKDNPTKSARLFLSYSFFLTICAITPKYLIKFLILK